MEVSPPRLLNPEITFITKEFVKLWIAGSWENMPGKHHCILALLLTSPSGIQYLTTVENQMQPRWILPPLKKCLRVLKMASTNRSICADIGTCVVDYGQWACPKKPNGSLTEFDARHNAIVCE